MSLGDATTALPENGGAPGASLGLTGPSQTMTTANTASAADESPQVKEVLSSEIGISVMLGRLKQSIASAKEFALFLKRRAQIEEDSAMALKKLCRTSQDGISRGDHRGGTFAKAYEDMLAINERMADNGVQFASSLNQMHEDLMELAAIAEKSRKGWKQNGLVAEQRVAELEAAMRKSKTKYDTLAEEYDRARTGDTSGQKGGKMFGFKGKSGAQHEEDLLRKAQAADQDYQSKVQTVQAERGELVSKTRPETVKALCDIVKECDSGLVLQLQKFASFNEKLVLSNGLSISPIKPGPDSRSLRECILAVDNEKDLHDYLSSHHNQVPKRAGSPKYEKNPLLNPTTRAPTSAFGAPPPSTSAGVPTPAPQPPTFQGSMSGRSNTFSDTTVSPPSQGSLGHSYGQSMGAVPMLGGAPRPSSQPQHDRSFSQGSMSSLNNGPGPGPGGPQYGLPRGPAPTQQQPQASNPRFNGSFGSVSSQGPPQLGALPFQSSHSSQQPAPQPSSYPTRQGIPDPLRQSPPSAPQLAPSRPVFGVALSRLYERDGLAVPMVVYQCIQAVDLYGLGVEGIYRLSGSVPHVNKLKNLFDTDSGSTNLDFRNPENFFHDVNSVAGLLKLFFRDLPDPLLTRDNYSAFIEAAKNEDDVVRRDSLHAIINGLPDPNYATLRALTLHLHRVIENSSSNRMSSQNLAIVFGPTLMGTAPGANISDAGWQVRVVDTILQNTYQIFDDDD